MKEKRNKQVKDAKNAKILFLKLIVTLIGVFTGVFLSFQLDRYINNRNELERYKKEVIALDMETISNFTYIYNFKKYFSNQKVFFLTLETICSENFLMQPEVNKYSHVRLILSLHSMNTVIRGFNEMNSYYIGTFKQKGILSDQEVKNLNNASSNAISLITDVQKEITVTMKKYKIDEPNEGQIRSVTYKIRSSVLVE